ncbi:hypothetical protein PSACC_00264 [Paramicrosporidium saccamoebae]|uniref:Small ribosomal subunit protein uS10 domain-containing protein n=1 Tax=Paramicrosporidium saccamoebae TaxID=1246581 RepID=A0A2H9TQ89_9FUNG|nr:hypothetical protein PSACC_00264 [Paramicrosporidium saccamoebae]
MFMLRRFTGPMWSTGRSISSMWSKGRCMQSTDRPELRARTIECIESVLSKPTAVAKTKRSTPLPCSLNVLIRGLSIPLLDAYLRFCLSAAHSLSSPTRHGALPTRIQRWSVLSSPHVHKTAWTQLERRVHRRVFGVYGMHEEVIPKFIWYVERHAPPDMKLEFSIHDYVKPEQ